MKFVVLIACHSSSESIYSTVESLSALKIPAELEQVIVMENGDEPTLDTQSLSNHGALPVSCYFTHQKGKSVALNVAIDAYVPDDSYILFTDDDIRFNSDWFLNYLNAFKTYGRGYFFGSSFGVDYEEAVDPDLLAALPPSARGVGDQVFQKNPSRAFLGCNWAAHKDDIIEAGWFDRNFGPGSKTGATGQEAEMQDRLRKLNLKPMLIENNPVWHKVPADKSSIEWAKQRARRTGKERFIREKGRAKWFLRTTVSTIRSGLLSLFGNRMRRYHYIINKIAIQSFLSQCFKGGR